MDQPLPPGGQPQAPAQSAPEKNMGPITKLAVSAHEQLGQLLDAVTGSPQIPDEIKKDLETVVAAFDGLVEKAIQSPRAQPPQMKQSGPLPAMAGSADVKPAY